MIGKNFVCALGISCLVAFGACACSANSKTEADVSVSEDAQTPAAADEGTVPETGQQTSSGSLDTSGWEMAWSGVSSTGYEVYYAESATGNEGMLVLHNPDANDTESFMGNTTIPEEGYVTVNGVGNACTFELLEAADDLSMIKLALGDKFGEAELKQCGIDELKAGVRAFDTNGEIIQ